MLYWTKNANLNKFNTGSWPFLQVEATAAKKEWLRLRNDVLINLILNAGRLLINLFIFINWFIGRYRII